MRAEVVREPMTGCSTNTSRKAIHSDMGARPCVKQEEGLDSTIVSDQPSKNTQKH